MVHYPDEYTMCKWFLVALQEPLCHEVLLQGHMTKFSHGAELALTAERIENAMRYDVGTWHPYGLNSSVAAQVRPVPARVTSTSGHPLRVNRRWMRKARHKTIWELAIQFPVKGTA